MTEIEERSGDHTEALQKPVPRTDTENTADGVYRRGAPVYRAAGWQGVLPLPPAAKQPLPTGFTGYDGLWPTDEQVTRWMSQKPAASNLGVRVEHGVVVLDIDAL